MTTLFTTLLAAHLAFGSTRELERSLPVDATVTGALAASWLLTEFALKGTIAPKACRWCATNAFDDWGRGLRATGQGVLVAETFSNVFGYAGVPLLSFGALALVAGIDGAFENMGWDLLISAEATMIAVMLNQLTKFLVARPRPYMSHPSADTASFVGKNDDFLSFFSGHATLSFALVASVATVARLRGYSKAYLAWLIPLPFAMATAMLRVAADKHYLTDVLVGAAVGSLVGFGSTWLFHNHEAQEDGLSLQFSPMPNGLMLSGRF